MEELNSSELGTQEYWDNRYKLEISNFRDHGEIGDVWFGEESVHRIFKWIRKENSLKSDCKILDLGCGNGAFLVELAQNCYTDLHGVDYSPDAIVLAEEVAKTENLNIKYNVLDILSDNINSEYDVVHDKGTYDAISLSSDAKTDRQTYINKVYNFVRPKGFFIITSCNWTQVELEDHFKNKFILHQIIPTPQFKFGGQTGNSVTSLVFNKVL